MLAGCVQNMADLKSTLGAEDAVEPPLAPAAKATASTAVALVGEVVRFSGAASTDPRGLPIDFSWHFGDGVGATGSEAEHAYLSAGSFAATLTVRNDGGIADVDVVRVDVRSPDLAPVASASATPASAWVGETVRFSPGGSYDPEGNAIRWLWDFGDDGSAAIAEPSHAFATPGRHAVTLAIVDSTGQETRTVVFVPVSLAENRTGVLDATAARIDIPLLVADSPARLKLALAFDGAPANDLGLEVRDAQGRLVDLTPAGGPQVVNGRVALDLLEPEGDAGEWTVSIVRNSGLRAAWTLSVLLAY